jgi:predicted ABC-type ATPase
MSGERPSEAFLLAGPNGAGKTTSARVLLPGGVTFLNADLIAAHLRQAGHADAGLDVAAGREVLAGIRHQEDTRESFCVETNLAGRGFVGPIHRWRREGYVVRLIFIALRSPELALSRVAERVATGGHDVPEATVRRRWASGLAALFATYLDVVDGWIVIDNSDVDAVLVANRPPGGAALVHDRTRWEYLRRAGGAG